MTTKEEKARRMRLRRKNGTRKASKPPEPLGRSKLYTIAHACFKCQKSFKVALQGNLKCPNCSAKLHEMGRSFKAPKRTDDEQWEKIEKLWEAGFRFSSYRSYPNAEPLPTALKDVPAFIERNPNHPMRVIDGIK